MSTIYFAIKKATAAVNTNPAINEIIILTNKYSNNLSIGDKIIKISL